MNKQNRPSARTGLWRRARSGALAVSLAASLLLALVPSVVTAAATAPTLSSLSSSAGPVGTQLTLDGSGLESPGTETGSVYFTPSGTTTPVIVPVSSGETDTSATVTVPDSLSTGSVTVAIYNATTQTLSNALPFSVTCTGVSVSTGTFVVAPGQTTLTVPITTDVDSPGLAGYDLAVAYNPQVIVATGVSAGTDGWNPTASLANASQGTITLDAAQSAGVIGNQTLANVTFNVTGSMGQATNVTLTVTDFTNPNTLSNDPTCPQTGTVSVLGSPATVTVTAPQSSVSTGTQLDLSGAVLDSAGDPLPNQTVDLSTTAGTLSASTVNTGTTGEYHATLTAPETSGSVIVTAVVSGTTITATLGVQVTEASSALSVTTTALSGGTVGTAYSATLAAEGGTAPYHWSVTEGSLPAGVSLDASTGVISGTPTASGTSSLTVQVTDSLSPVETAAANLSMVVTPAALAVTTTALPGGTVGTAYSATLVAEGGTAPYHWSVTEGSLPTGLSMDGSTGVISGTPTEAGTSSLTVQVTDSSSPVETAAVNLSMVVSPAALAVTTTAVPGGTVGTAYSATLAAEGGTAPYHWSVTEGSLPTGVSLDASTGVISGTPTEAGTSSLTVQVTDSSSPVETSAASLVVITAPKGVTVTGTASARNSNPNVPVTVGGAGSKTPGTQIIARGGTGVVAIASYNKDPRGVPTFTSAGVYFDAAVAPHSTFQSVTLTQCDLNGGTIIYWWNGTTWAPASDQSFSNGCATVIVNATTSPNLSQLTGTVFAVGIQAPGSSTQGSVTSSGITSPTLTESVAATLPCPLPSGLRADSHAIILSGPVPITPQVVQLHYVAPSGSGVSVFVLHAGCSWTFVPTAVNMSLGTASVFAPGPETLIVASNSNLFADVPANYWPRSAIESLAAANVVTGFPNGTFEPDANMTRAQFVKMFVVTLGLASVPGGTVFTDVPADAWYAPYVSAAVQAGLVTGVTSTTFEPDAAVTREEVAVLLTRALQLSGTVTLSFSDRGEIAPWARSGVEAAVAAGYLNGFPDGTFQPTAPMTRAQVATLLARVIAHEAP